MSKGWEEVRLGQDGRWQPTGQLRDAFPFAAPSGEPNAPGSAKFHVVVGLDTDWNHRSISIAGDPPAMLDPQGTVGWSPFSRP